MNILFPYDTDDLGIFAETKVAIGTSTPILRNYNYTPLPVRKIPPRKRNRVLREYIDKTDVFALVSGTWTFMRPWCHFSMAYAFTRNRPLMDIDTTFIRDGWDNELTSGPNPFSRVRWTIQGPTVQVYTADPIFEVTWRKRASLARTSVRYRLQGDDGFVDEVAPRYEWTRDNADQNFSQWLERSIWLAGL